MEKLGLRRCNKNDMMELLDCRKTYLWSITGSFFQKVREQQKRMVTFTGTKISIWRIVLIGNV